MKSSFETRVAVVGLGKMGIMHAAMARVVPGTTLVAVCDRDKGLEAHVAGLGVRAPFFTSFEAMLEKAKPNILIVSTPQFAHRSPSLTALRRGVAVLCEKPLAHTLREARAMVDAIGEHPDVPGAVGLMVAHYPIYRHAARLLSEDVLGPIQGYHAKMLLSQVFSAKKGWIYTKERSGGGVLINSGPHILHLLIRWFGLPGGVEAACTSVHSREVEDRVDAVLHHTNGVRGELLADWSVGGYPTQWHEIEITGERGRLTLTDREATLKTRDETQHWHEADFEQPAFNLTPHYGGAGFYFQLADLAACLRGERERPLVDWQDGLAVNILLDAIYQASDAGRPVDVEAASRTQGD